MQPPPSDTRVLHQKPSNARQQSINKKSETVPKIVQNRGLEGVWATLGWLLADSRAALGHLLPPRHLWAASWPPLGQLLGGS